MSECSRDKATPLKANRPVRSTVLFFAGRPLRLVRTFDPPRDRKKPPHHGLTPCSYDRPRAAPKHSVKAGVSTGGENLQELHEGTIRSKQANDQPHRPRAVRKSHESGRPGIRNRMFETSGGRRPNLHVVRHERQNSNEGYAEPCRPAPNIQAAMV